MVKHVLSVLILATIAVPAHADDIHTIRRECKREATDAYFRQHSGQGIGLAFGAVGGALDALMQTRGQDKEIKISDLDRMARECVNRRLSVSSSQPSPAIPPQQPLPPQSPGG